MSIFHLAVIVLAALALRAYFRERRYQRAERAVAKRLVYLVRNPADEALTREMWRQQWESVEKTKQKYLDTVRAADEARCAAYRAKQERDRLAYQAATPRIMREAYQRNPHWGPLPDQYKEATV